MLSLIARGEVHLWMYKFIYEASRSHIACLILHLRLFIFRSTERQTDKTTYQKRFQFCCTDSSVACRVALVNAIHMHNAAKLNRQLEPDNGTQCTHIDWLVNVIIINLCAQFVICYQIYENSLSQRYWESEIWLQFVKKIGVHYLYIQCMGA